MHDFRFYTLGVLESKTVQSHTAKVLEFDKVLEMVRDRCRTTLGEDRAATLEPSFEFSTIEIRLKQTNEAMEMTRQSLPPEIGGTRDVRHPVTLASKGSSISGEELFRTHESLECMASLRRYLMQLKQVGPSLWMFGDQLPYLSDLAERIARSVSPDGDVLDSASDELRKIRTQLNTHQRRLASKLQSMIAGPLKSYLQEPIFTMRSGRYVVPVKAQYRNRVPGIVHDASATGHTVFVEPQAVIEEDDKLRELEAAEREEVSRILSSLSAEVGRHGTEIVRGLDAVTEIDIIFARAYFAQDFHCAAPILQQKPMLSVQAAHHPLLNRSISVPISVSIGDGYGSLLITGPNTGGKTVTLKLLGLCCMMIGCGIFPPADSVRYGPFSEIWADIGDEQSIQQSLSTFSGHLKVQANLIANLKPGALVLIDEVGAGTDPKEGAALGRAILEAIVEKGGLVAASTHYGELKSFAQQSEKFFCAAMEFDVESLRPTYKLLIGAAGSSHALEIARRYNIPEKVIEQSEQYLGSEALEDRKRSHEIDLSLKQARDDRQAAQEIRRNLETELERTQLERESMKEKLRRVQTESQETISNAIRETRAQYRELLDELNDLIANQQISEDQRNEFVEKAKSAGQIVEQLKTTEPESSEVGAFEVGDNVILRKTGQHGKVQQVQSNGKVVILIGSIKLTVLPEDLERAKKSPRQTPVTKRPRAGVQARMTASTEIHLRQMRAEDALEQLEKFLDEVTLAGVERVRIVHGKGEGVLRKLVREFLKSRTDVREFREGETGEGGAGVTVVYFK